MGTGKSDYNTGASVNRGAGKSTILDLGPPDPVTSMGKSTASKFTIVGSQYGSMQTRTMCNKYESKYVMNIELKVNFTYKILILTYDVRNPAEICQISDVTMMIM